MASALAFYVAALGMLLTIPRFAVDIPKAHDGETTGAAIGSLIGAGIHTVSTRPSALARNDTAHRPVGPRV